MRVLLTGATGYIASQLLPVFRERYDLRLVDVRGADAAGRPVEGAQIVNLIEDADDALQAHFAGMYASGAFGRKLGVVQVRIGAPREIDASAFENKPAAYKRDLGAYISARDLQQLFVRSLETEPIADEWSVPFQIFYGISDNTRAFWSIANARRIIGYDPEDDSEVRYAADIQRLLIGPAQKGRLGAT